VDEAEEETKEAEEVGNNNAVAESVASDAVADIAVTELGFAMKTPPDTAGDIDWLVLEVLLLSKVMAKVKDFSIIIVTSRVVVK
jgi:hypothetical protein